MSSSTTPYGVGQVPELAPPGKKAIPRLQRPGQALPPAKDRRRVSRACTACRTHKIKCSGETPLCKHCQSTGRDCIYILPRKDRLKNVTERCNQMAAYLRTLQRFAGEEESLKIGELLDAVDEDATMAAGPSLSNPDTDGDEQSRGQLEGVASEVNIDSLDLLDENLHVNPRSLATGFVGKNSEVQWLRTLLTQDHYRDDLSRQASDAQGAFTSGAMGDQVSSLSFYLDGEFDRDFFNDQWGDPYALPPLEIAQQFVRNYMDTVHDSFPILHRKVFEDRVDKLYSSGLGHPTLQRVDPKWGAILNLVFAIGARYSHLAEKPRFEADDRDHLIYQSKARYFGWNSSTLSQHPDLPQIQIAGMLAFYYLSVGQVSRGWVVVGMALRFAVALGLHVRNEDPSTSTPKRESLLRIWWALYSLDRQLSIITGRPSVVVDSCCSVPLPMPFPEDEITDDMESLNRLRRASTMSTSTSISTLAPTSPTYTNHYSTGGMDVPRTPITFPISGANPGSFFRAVVQMGTITQSILSSLYTAGTMIRPSGELQQDIALLNRRLDEWVTALPAEFDFRTRRSGVSTPTRSHFRERTLLGFQFYSAKILLTRPYFSGGSQSRKEAKDVAASAGISRPTSLCVDAAKKEVDMLPDQPGPFFLWKYGPWWCIVHYLMQALAVLLLALDSSTTSSHDRADLATYLKKIVRSLRCMNDMTARTAYRIAFRSFDMVAKRASIPMDDMWAEHNLHERNTGPDVMGAANMEFGGYQMDTGSGYGPSVEAFIPIMSISGPPPSIVPTSLFPNPLAMPTAFPSHSGGPLVNDSFYHPNN